MNRNLIFLFLIATASFLFSCKKKDEKPRYAINYKLIGKYERDTAVKSDGYKLLDLRSDGNYCWTRVIEGLDSNFCNGKYEQTSDTSLLWESVNLVTFKITPIDTMPGWIQLQMNAVPPMYPLYGKYVKP